MEKRKKNITADDFLEINDEQIETSEDITKKSKHQLTPTAAFVSFTVIVLIYCIYVLMLGPNDKLPSLTLHIPSFREDIDIRLPSISKDALPVFTVNDNLKSKESVSIDAGPTISELQASVDELISKIRAIKVHHEAIDLTPGGAELKKSLQEKLKVLLHKKYGPGPYLIEMKLKFPGTMEDYQTEGPNGVIVIQLAPIDLLPYNVYYFLDMIEHWKGGYFHRVAGHVLQAQVSGQMPGLAFQEYHPDFPHKPLTMGYAGRPGGPAFYINTVDNTQNHGPGSQGSKSEADGIFGKVLVGHSVVERIKKQPGKTKPMGFINLPEYYIHIESLSLAS